MNPKWCVDIPFKKHTTIQTWEDFVTLLLIIYSINGDADYIEMAQVLKTPN
jgi:hypothetical protein